MSAEKTKSKKTEKDEPVEEELSVLEEPTDESSSESTPDEVEEDILAVEDQVAILKDRSLRLQADFDNYRKRMARERGEISLRANERLMEELLPVLDHFEMGLKTAAQQDLEASVIDGFEIVYQQLMQALGKFDLQPIEAEGKPFDPHHHEAVTHVPSDEHPPDTVVAQTRCGYKLGKKLLRAAQVVVSSGSAEIASDETALQDGSEA